MYGKSYKTITVTTTVAAAIEDAFSEVSLLAEEIREWSDKMQESEGLSQTEKASSVEEAADALEEHQEFNEEVPEAFNERLLTAQQGVKRYRSDGAPSRAARLGNAAALMHAVVDAAEERMNELDVALDELVGDRRDNLDLFSAEETESMNKLSAERDEIEAVYEHASDIADAWDNIEIPGMYG